MTQVLSHSICMTVELGAILSKSVWHEETKNSFADDSIIPILGICHKKIIRNAGKSVHCSIFIIIDPDRDFPGGTVVKNPPANAGNMGSSPGPGRSPMPWSN